VIVKLYGTNRELLNYRVSQSREPESNGAVARASRAQRLAPIGGNADAYVTYVTRAIKITWKINKCASCASIMA
jgi:hypothetical protein